MKAPILRSESLVLRSEICKGKPDSGVGNRFHVASIQLTLPFGRRQDAGLHLTACIDMESCYSLHYTVGSVE